jgi:hypothetical protein
MTAAALRCILAFEEFHRLVRPEYASGTAAGVPDTKGSLQDQVAEAVATLRARKIGWVSSTPSPSHMPLDILRMPQTFMTFRTAHAADRQAIAEQTDMLPGQSESLVRLGLGQAYIHSLGMTYPRLLQCRPPEHPSRGDVSDNELAKHLRNQDWFLEGEAKRVADELAQFEQALKAFSEVIAQRLAMLERLSLSTTGKSSDVRVPTLFRQYERRLRLDLEAFTYRVAAPLLGDTMNLAHLPGDLRKRRQVLAKWFSDLQHSVNASLHKLRDVVERFNVPDLPDKE